MLCLLIKWASIASCLYRVSDRIIRKKRTGRLIMFVVPDISQTLHLEITEIPFLMMHCATRCHTSIGVDCNRSIGIKTGLIIQIATLQHNFRVITLKAGIVRYPLLRKLKILQMLEW
jgi:hypothetical protein